VIDFGGQGDHSMRIDTPSNPAIVGTRAVFIALFAFLASLSSIMLVAGGTDAKAANGPQILADLLAGKTLSAVTWVPRPAAAPGGGGLSRFVLQAYLRQDGSALIRIWDPARNAYTRPVERNWTLSGSRLCLDLPNPGPGRICAEVHSWGPRIAGIGTAPYVMFDGDLKPGNALLGTR
jgi:hypothetical protein